MSNSSTSVFLAGAGSGSGPSWSQRLEGVSPATLLAVFIGLQILVWTLVPWATAVSLPLDVVSDGLEWGHEWQWGYYKHPPLPSWTVELFFDALGDFGPFLLSQLAVGATYALVFLLAREMMPARAALFGTVLLAGVYYFSIPTPEFNHNVAQMPVWALASFAYLKALRTERAGWWAVLGLAGGAAILTKYASAVLFLAMLAHLLSTRKTAALLAKPGPYLALGVFVAVAAPHLLWLYRNHFPTFHYAEARAGLTGGFLHRLLSPFRFLVSQAVTLLPALLVAFAVGLVRRGSFAAAPPLRDDNFRFLLFLGLGPALITAVLSLVTGFGIRDMWGAPMWNLTGVALVDATRSQWNRAPLAKLCAWTIALFAVLPSAYVLSTSLAPEWLGKPSRTQWPDRKLAEVFSSTWTRATHRPLDIVAGDGWLAGLVAMRLPSRPSVFIDGSFREAPWITPARLAREGALVVWQTHGADSPPSGLDLPELKIMGAKTFAWPREPHAKPLRVGWGVVMPAGASSR